MNYSTLISAEELVQQLNSPGCLVVDCRFSLAEPELGRSHYLAAHIPGAVYAHLDEDLSGRIIPGETSRHPLPTQEEVDALFSSWGIGPDTQVVAYDDSGGSIAGRLWWMLQWQGHAASAVLNGGWQAWTSGELPVRNGEESRIPGNFIGRPNPTMVATTAEVEEMSTQGTGLLIDSRASERFSGDIEPIDRVGGHIPGARNADHQATLNADGFYLSPIELDRHFQNILGGRAPQEVVFYCGSGVSAAQNLLGMAAAGIFGGRLYVGSWSEWINDPSHLIETGTGDPLITRTSS
jgi:thiosulfate/3-mercaptopyruvate sulfurtransferase